MTNLGRDVPTVLIHRQVSFSLEAFDLLKDFQRRLERAEGRRMCNSEALNRLILSLALE